MHKSKYAANGGWKKLRSHPVELIDECTLTNIHLFVLSLYMLRQSSGRGIRAGYRDRKTLANDNKIQANLWLGLSAMASRS